MRIATFAIASSIALALSSAAMAEETQVSATPVSDSQKIVCHNMTHQGMLIGKPQCRTQYAWDKERRLQQAQLEDIQRRALQTGTK
jgi:hypothetical protein